MEVLFLIVVLALITIIICVTAGVISNRKKGGSEEMGGEPAGEKAEKKPEKTGEKRRRAPEAPDPRLHVIYMEEESFTKKNGPDKAGFHLAGDLAEEFSRPERKPKWVCPVCEAENSVKSFRCEVCGARKP